MRLALIAAAALFLAQPAAADVRAVVEEQALPGFARLAAAAAGLAAAAAGGTESAEPGAADCGGAAVRDAFHATFDAWMGVSHLRLGPSETAALSIAFWPDERGATQRVLAGLLAEAEPLPTPAGYAEVSAAGRGLFALEALLYDDALAARAAPGRRCALLALVADDLARQTAALAADWRDGFAPILLSAGEAGNAVFLTGDEALGALYTQLTAGLEFTRDQRIGRPLGSFDRPRPQRAEAWRSGRSLRNVALSLAALHALADLLADEPIPATDAAFAAARDAADRVGDPAFRSVGDPAVRFRLEVLRQRIATAAARAAEDLGGTMGISPGFNALDGD